MDKGAPGEVQDYPRLLAAVEKLLPGPREHPPFDAFLRYLEGEGGFDVAVLYFQALDHGDHSLVLAPSAHHITGSGPGADCFATYEKLALPPFNRVLSVRELPGEGGPDGPYTRRFLAPNHLADALVVNVRHSSALSARLLVAIREGWVLSDSDRAFVNRLVPSLTAAISNFQYLNYLQAKSNLYDELVARIGVGEFRLNAAGEVTYSNAMAQALLHDGHLLVCRSGRLHAVDRDDDARLQSTLARYIEDAPIKLSEPIYLHSREPFDTVGVLVRKLPPQHDRNHDNNAVVGVYLGDHSRRLRLSGDLLRKLFDFSGAEARVAVLLAQGHNAKEVAQLLHVSSNTVRSHIARIYAKTGINRQAELSAMLVRTLASSWGDDIDSS